MVNIRFNNRIYGNPTWDVHAYKIDQHTHAENEKSDSEFCRILRSAVRKAINIEQRAYPRNLNDIERTIRLQSFADRFRAFERQGI
jgi:hypothetical protein